jgi:hypothetical protein
MLQLAKFHFSAMGSFCALHLYAAGYTTAEMMAQSAMAEITRIQRQYFNHCYVAWSSWKAMVERITSSVCMPG